MFSTRIEKELAKGSHELIILKLLSRKDMYGYQLVQEMTFLSEGAFSMSQGSLYPFLHALEDKKLVKSYVRQEGGRERRYYRLTASGRDALTDKEAQWRRYVNAMERIIGPIVKQSLTNANKRGGQT